MDALPGVELENDAEDNPCFGCGPANPIGLRMRFFDDGHVVRSRLTLDDRYCGSWGRVLEPIVYATMDEIIVWTAWARFGELARGAAPAPARLSFQGRVATGAPFLVECSVVRDDGEAKLLRALVTQDGAGKAVMEWPMRRMTRAEIEAALAGEKLSRSIREELERMRGERGPVE